MDWDALARFLAGESTPAEAAAMREWIAARPERAELVATLDDATAGVADAGAPIDVEAALARVTARLDEPEVRPLRASAPTMAVGGHRVRTLALRAAAAVLLVAGAATLWRTTHGAGRLAEARSYATGVGARDSVRLPDGTRVLLGPDSRLDVAAGYGDTIRLVTLIGEAYFDVRHDARREFTVRVGHATIRDVGTAFTVRIDSWGIVRVGVTEGAVSVIEDAVTADPAPVLRRGDEAEFGTGRFETRKGVVTADDTAWTQGRLVFRDAPLAVVTEDIRRWYGVDLQVADSTLASRHLTASFNGEPVGRVLDVIALTLGATVERHGTTAVLRPTTAGGAAR